MSHEIPGPAEGAHPALFSRGTLRLRNLPNLLTAVRLLLIPVFLLLMVDPSRDQVWAATAVFLVAALTDYVDGFLARRLGAVSDLGKLLDPLADKILVMAALVMLTGLRSEEFGEPWVPAWMVVLVLAREFWVTGLRGVAAARGVVVAASGSGKVKSVLQMVAVILLLLHDVTVPLFGIVLSAQLLGANVLLVSIFVSYWGAIEYSIAIAGASPGRDRPPFVH